VPGLVAEVYGDGVVCPPEWGDGEEQARAEWEGELRKRADKARGRVLTREGEWASRTLEGLHEDGTGFAREEELRALVRDGEESAEVIVVRRDERGYLALDGTRLGVLGEASEQVRDAVLGGTTRLPAKPALTKAVEAECVPLPGWGQVPWLAYAKALVLDDSGWAEVGEFRLGYDHVLGLIVEDR
jgi:CRISPR-associated endonuclease/helicase Cas3